MSLKKGEPSSSPFFVFVNSSQIENVIPALSASKRLQASPEASSDCVAYLLLLNFGEN
jgi:hypothetical protein